MSAPMTPDVALTRLRQYGERTSTWSTATYNDGTEKALHEIALTLAAEVDRLRARVAELEAASPWQRAVDGLNALVDADVIFHVEPDGHISAPFSDEHIEWDLKARRWVLTHDDEDEGLPPVVSAEEAELAAVERSIAAQFPLLTALRTEAAAAPSTGQCGHDDYHGAHPWADRPHIWCPGHSYENSPSPMTAAEWNERYPVGTPVLAYPGSRDAEPLDTVTRTPAWALGHGAAVVSVEGASGGICLTHVDPIGGAA